MPLKQDSLTLQSHLLHGVIHCNGFGHLLCINGVESDSKHLHGNELMNFWDHLCSVLQAREISVHDVSKKGSMELRLLHGVAFGRPWFGKWDYKFCHGCFGVTLQKYDRAIQILGSLELDKVIHDFSKTNKRKQIQQIFQTYRDVSDTKLVTISDLLQFMLAFQFQSPIERKAALEFASFSSESSPGITHESDNALHSCSNDHYLSSSHQGKDALPGNTIACNSLASFVGKLDARWPARRLEDTVKQILNVLEVHGATMRRQDLRDAVRQHIGDTGLIDYIIKNVDGATVGNQVIRRKINRTTRLVEFSLQHVDHVEKIESKITSSSGSVALKPGVDVHEDILFLYKNVLLGYPLYYSVSTSTKTILDSKHFVKKWQFKESNEDKLLRLVCHVRLSYDELVYEFTRTLPPGVLVVVPKCVSIGELKLIVQCALRDTYCVMDKFVVRDIKIGGLDRRREEQDVLMCEVNEGIEAFVRGYGLDLDTKLRYQGGDDDWKVDCRCGAKDDDGERMVACDACHVWQHTCCNGIEDEKSAPSVFLCFRCLPGKRMKN